MRIASDGAPLNEKKVWLQDDYVKFIRVVANDSQQLLTSASLGSSVTTVISTTQRSEECGGSLLNSFPQLYLLDAHGSTKDVPDGYRRTERL